MLAVNCASAVADPDCWYEYQYGTHDYEQVDARKPTCTEDGYYLLECRQCGKNVRKITGNATGHSWKEVKRAHSCVDPAEKMFVIFSRC